MAYEYLGLQVELPFGPASGAINGPNVDSIVERTRQVLQSPVDIARWGSATYNGGQGNAHYGQTYYHNEITGQTVNSEGLPSVSIETMEKVLPALLKEAEDRGKVLVPSVSPAKGEDPLEVLPEMAERLVAAGAKRIEVNYSCPNKIVEGGGREPILSHDLETMVEVDQAILVRVGNDIWIVRKIAPTVGEKKSLIVPTAGYFAGVRGLVALSFNTIGGQRILDEWGDPALDVPENLGGLSGPATQFVGQRLLEAFRKLLPDSVQIDMPLGVMHGDEVFGRVHNGGANFTSAVTLYRENLKNGIDFRQTGIQVRDQFYARKEREGLTE